MSCRTIPWLKLGFGFLWYASAGFFLANTPLWVKVWAWAEAIAGAWAWTLALAGFTALVWTGVLPVAWALAEAITGSRPVTKTLAGVGVVILAATVAVVLAMTGATACAVAWALAWAWTGSRGGARTVCRILAQTMVMATALSLAGCTVLGIMTWTVLGAFLGARILGWLVVVAWTLTLPLGLVGVLAEVWAVVENELPRSFSQFHTFLILAFTSLSGMGLGSLVNLISHLS